ncbi:MAG: hypothetical protein QOD77_1762 [Thermoplasmata archaeon]|jgi:hypothetical protein|nr:hypothetical protein [Thermoplasmata archaeon]
MTQTHLAIALLVAALLAGCAADDGPTTRILLDFPAPHADVDATVPAAEAATAYHQLLAWSHHSGVRVDMQEFSFGHCLDAIDGVPKTPGCSQGAEGHWALALNGVASMTGMDDVQVHAGDTVSWTYTPLDQDSEGSSTSPTAASGTATATPTAAAPLKPATGPLTLTVTAPAPTRSATLVLAGTVDRAVRLTVTNATTADVPAGPWSVTVPLDYGQTPLRVLADDGKATAVRDVVAVRLASARVQAEFTAAIPQKAPLDDEVWLDIDAFLSAPDYDGKPIAHPPHANVHDVLVAWTQTGRAVEFSFNDSFGFGVESIDGYGALSDWCYDVNGASAPLGITGMAFQPGDEIAWHGCVLV